MEHVSDEDCHHLLVSDSSICSEPSCPPASHIACQVQTCLCISNLYGAINICHIGCLFALTRLRLIPQSVHPVANRLRAQFFLHVACDRV